MKINLCICIILSTLLITCTTNDKGSRNYQNSKKIRIGMTLDSLVAVMGKPDTITAGNIFLTYPATARVFSYKNTSWSSDQINVVIDTSDVVINILSSD